MVVHLVLALEDAVEDVAHVGVDGVTHDALYAAAAEGAFRGDGLRQFGHLVAVGADVAGNVEAEVADVATIAQVELKASVLYLTGIDPLGTAFTHDAYARHVDQNVLGLLEVPLNATVQGIVEEAEVKTKVGLCGGLPLDVVIAQLLALEA